MTQTVADRTHDIAYSIAKAIESQRFNLSSEKRTQHDIADYFCVGIDSVLPPKGLPCPKREFRLSDKDIPDFFFEFWGIVLEIKSPHATASDTLRQLNRYAAHERVTALILASARAVSLPSVLNGKPLFVISLGKAWI